MFDLFTQAKPSVNRALGGLGIGLTLARRLLELQGGAICVDRDGLGIGSEFSIELPLAVASELVEPDAVERIGASLNHQLRILLVDYHIDSAESLLLLLESNGDDLRLAHDGEAAVSGARSFLSDVVLLDIGLPGLSDYQVAKHSVLVAKRVTGDPKTSAARSRRASTMI